MPYYLLLFGLMLSFLACKKPQAPDPNFPNSSNEYYLMIPDGAKSGSPWFRHSYQAVLRRKNGDIVQAQRLTWSSSNPNVASINANGEVQAHQEGTSLIRAEVEHNGLVLSTEVPLLIERGSLVSVLPAALVGQPYGEPVQLITFFNALDTPVYVYESSDPSIARVSPSGQIQYLRPGYCEIRVIADNILGRPEKIVPVLVNPPVQTDLPIARIEISPKAAIGLGTQFRAVAYDKNGHVVEANFTWSINEPQSSWRIDDNGRVSHVATNSPLDPYQRPPNFNTRRHICVSAEGMTAQAEFYAQPLATLVFSPSSTWLEADSSLQFEVHAYNRLAQIGPNYFVSGSPQTPQDVLHWGLDSRFGSISTNGLVRLNSNLSPGTVVPLSVFVTNSYYRGGYAQIIVR